MLRRYGMTRLAAISRTPRIWVRLTPLSRLRQRMFIDATVVLPPAGP
jgi:hypothetical protein